MENKKQNLVCVKLDEKFFYGVTPDAKRHLLNSLRSLEFGQAPTPSFPLYGKTDISVATDFLNLIRRKRSLPKWLIPYEESRLEKFGPQGGHAPWLELKENAELYFTRPKTLRDVSEVKDVNAKYRALHCTMFSKQAAMQTLKDDDKIKERAAGWPTFNLKKTSPEAQSRALHLANYHSYAPHAYGYFFSRFNKQKKRLFVPMPFCNMINQAQYFNPFLKAIQNDLRLRKNSSPFRFWADKIGFGPCFTEIIGPHCAKYDPDHLVYIMRDFEKMDTTTGVYQKVKSFIPKLAKAFNFNIKSVPHRQMTEAILFSNRCPIATPDGMWLTSAPTGHGEASGATVTNGGETCVNEDYDASFTNRLIAKCRKTRIKIEIIISVGNGDDGETIVYLQDLDRFEELKVLIADAANEAAEEFGLRVQGEKWDIILGHGKYCQYLNYYDGKEMKFMYPAVLILNSIVNPEKEYKPSEWDKDYRDLDIIEKLDNGVGLPYYHELVDYVDNGMKYGLLGRSETETSRILSKFDRYRALQDESRKFNFISEDIEADISKSPTVNYLLRKRMKTARSSANSN